MKSRGPCAPLRRKCLAELTLLLIEGQEPQASRLVLHGLRLCQLGRRPELNRLLPGTLVMPHNLLQIGLMQNMLTLLLGHEPFPHKLLLSLPRHLLLRPLGLALVELFTKVLVLGVEAHRLLRLQPL